MTSPTSGTYTPLPAHGDCPSGKVQFANRKQAKRVRRKFQDSALGPYDCDQCQFWHLGHKPQRVRNGQITKDAWLATKGNR